MENLYESHSNGNMTDPGLQIIRHPSYQSPGRFSFSWFDIRVFYVRISNFMVDNSTPECLTLNHIPLSPDTLLEKNGVRCAMDSEGISSILRRDRVDKKSEEATFVSTDGIRLTGSVKFEVFDKEDLVISGVLEMSGSNGFTGESNNLAKKWSMNCESIINGGMGFLKGKQIVGCESSSPSIEVYVAGCFSGTPIILTKSLQISPRKKHRKGALYPIPENDASETNEDLANGHDLQDLKSMDFKFVNKSMKFVWMYPSYNGFQITQTFTLSYFLHNYGGFQMTPFQVADYRNYKPESDEDFDSLYWRRTEYIEGEDGELSWFNAGVRVGVGIGLGICLGIGIGVGLLVRTYQTTTGTFKRRLI